MGLQALFRALLAISAVCTSAHASGPLWPLQYRDDSTNSFIWDKRARALIESKTHPAFADELEAALGGPPGPVVVERDRYFAVSACVAHDCTRKGFLWLDTQSGQGLGAIFEASYPSNEGQLELDSRQVQGEMPQAARLALINWLDEVRAKPTAVAFTDASGARLPLAIAALQPPERFRPREGGPSFDCARAGTSTESMLCADPELAARDLKLSEQYARMLISQSDLPSRRQLRALEQLWLQRRDARCEGAPTRSECLALAYDEQSKFLSSWIRLPSRPQDLAGLSRTGFHSGELVYRGRQYAVIKRANAGERIPSFNLGLNARHLAVVDSCAVLVDLPVGTAHGNHAYGGVCSQSGPHKATVLVCNDDMLGRFGWRSIAGSRVSIEELAYFVADQCYGG